VTFIILLAVVGGLAYRIVPPEDRQRHLATAVKYLQQLKATATEPGPEHAAFLEALRTRAPFPFATYGIVLVVVTIFGGMAIGAAPMASPETLVAWGASLGTRTTNGEWWRLVTAVFVHTGMLHLLIDAAVLIQLGGILERMYGRVTFVAVYLAAGVFAGLVHLSHYPLAVGVGASAAVFGLYGLFLAAVAWQMFNGYRNQSYAEAEEIPPPRLAFPLVTVQRIGVGAGVFFVYSALGGFVHTAEFTALLIGLAYGLVFSSRIGEERPSTHHVGVAIGATSVVAIACAIPMRNIVDVKPEIARVLAVEERTAAAFKTGFTAYRNGRMNAEALAQLAEHNMPELEVMNTHLKALVNVPPEHQPLVADAREFLRLRYASWRAHAEAIRKTNPNARRVPEELAVANRRLQAEARFRSNLATMGAVEGAERASMEALQRIIPAKTSVQVVAGR
jgi:membrane associated rhomboid family serine protease